jgi:hypothetical protein
MKRKTLGSALLSLGLFATIAHAEVISVNFTDGGKNYQIPAATAAGIGGYTNWNNAAGGSGSDVVLNDSDGNATAARLTFSCKNTWYDDTAFSDADAGNGDAMLAAGYLDDGSNGNEPVADIKITGISGTYSVIVYMATDADGGVYLPVKINGTDYSTSGTKQEYGSSAGGVNYWDVSNTITVSGLTGDLTVVGVNRGTSDRCTIGGVQVIPEPAALGLVGMVAGVMLFIRRRFMI